MAATDTTMPSRRVSTSVAASNERHDRARDRGAVVGGLGVIPVPV
jgi:hypothetical protein